MADGNQDAAGRRRLSNAEPVTVGVDAAAKAKAQLELLPHWNGATMSLTNTFVRPPAHKDGDIVIQCGRKSGPGNGEHSAARRAAYLRRADRGDA